MQGVIPGRNFESESTPAHTVFHAGVTGLAHNEAAFHHFLSIERRRAERAAHSVLLVLVSMRVRIGRSTRLEPPMAAAAFSALGASVRDADFIGWYREDRVAAAVLTHLPGPPDQISLRVTGRVVDALRQQPGGPMPFRVWALPLRSKARA